MVNFVVAIPSYNRENIITTKTLKTLIDGGISPKKIYIFVANSQQYSLYTNVVPSNLYNKIIIGKKGITNQRKFISQWFPEGQYIISIDDDVDEIQVLNKNGDKLVKLKDMNDFFVSSYKLLKKEKLYIWGIYPVQNSFFMKKTITTDLRFIIGVLFGYINRHDKKLYPSIQSESKEDYEQTILYYKMDGGVLRYNFITTKTKFNAEGGLGKDRRKSNADAASYLKKKYPDIITIFYRKNGMTEVKMSLLPRILD
jgi:hypothetical protein